MELRRKALLLAGLGSCSMATAHLFLPTAYGWKQYFSLVPPRMALAVGIVHLFCSFLILWGGCLSILVAIRRERPGGISHLTVYALATFWALYVVYQVRVPPPVPDVTQKTLLATAGIITVLYLFYLLTRDHAGTGTGDTKSAPELEARR